MHDSWKMLLADEFDKPYFKTLTDFVRQEYQTTKVFPPPQRIFAALDHCPVDQVKVVIIGQDPYHGPGQANGLSFSVNQGVALPPSLQNIFKELQDDLGLAIPLSGDLEPWAGQGVLMLNAMLTVRAHQAGSHQQRGWEQFTDAIIKRLSEDKSGLIFLLWGNYAKHKGEVIDATKHHVLSSAHPSPFSAYNGFFGNKHFSKTNQLLVTMGKAPINWEIKNN